MTSCTLIPVSNTGPFQKTYWFSFGILKLGRKFGKGVMYLALLGRPTDIGLQLDKTCYPYSR